VSTVRVLKPRTRVVLNDDKILNSYASGDYISTVFAELGTEMPLEKVSRLKKIFSKASHLKAMTVGYEVASVSSRVYDILPSTSEVDVNLLDDINKGVLAGHPTLPSLEGLLSPQETKLVIELLTGKRYEGGMTPNEWLFGDDTWVVLCKLGHSFDDMAQFARRRLISNSRHVPLLHCGLSVWT